MKKQTEISVIGAGMWGAVLANLLAREGRTVRAWEFKASTARSLNGTRAHPALPGFRLAKEIKVSTRLEEAVCSPKLLVMAVDSKHVRALSRQINILLKDQPLPLIVAVAKGIEAGSLKTVCEVMEEEIPRAHQKTMILTGPSFAVEVAAGAPTKVVLAGKDPDLVKAAAAIIEGGPLRLELSDDRLGAELGGALKNVYAIGSGIIDGLSKAAKNSEAAFLIESASELKRIITALGGRSHTAWGLSGMGDLLLTATSAKSRNFRFGREIGKGRTPLEAQRHIKTVVEGFAALENARALCAKRAIKTPVINSIWKILYKDHNPSSILEAAGFKRTQHPSGKL
ncbi:MAG: NAD(P)H-dependent glycerol-3-phosphate dehydrogenase [Elusimicrobiota bacterium]